MPAPWIASTYEQSLAPIADSLWLSAVVAMLPLVTIFALLGWLRLSAHVAGLAALAVAAVVAILGFGMPVHLTLLSASQGAVFGLFPILTIVLMALWIYQLTVVTDRFEDLRTAFGYVSGDPRVQAIIVAFCFGALLEALAGFGAPVAITGVMLMAVGFSPLRAAGVVLVANTAPVAFGAIGIPIITAGTLTGIPYEDIGAYVGRQTPILALFVPLILVYLADGRRGVRQTWPVALVAGVAFAVAQFVSSNYISVELTDIIAALASLAAVVALLKFWQPQGGQEAQQTLTGLAESEREGGNPPRTSDAPDAPEPVSSGGAAAVVAEAVPVPALDATTGSRLSAARMTMAFLPYLLVVAVFSIAQLVTPVKDWLSSTDVAIAWPWLDGNIIGVSGEPSSSTVYNFAWLSSAGTLLLLCGVVVTLAYRLSPTVAAEQLLETAVKLKGAAMTVCAVLALAYVMNQSGQTVTIGAWIAGTGAAFAFLSPILGWLGTAVTGSDTSANALFATLQQEAAIKAGIDPTLLVAANTSGGVVGKMISLQNLAIAASAVGIVGRESELLRFAIRWSLGLLLVICLLVGLQSTPVLGWMLP